MDSRRILTIGVLVLTLVLGAAAVYFGYQLSTEDQAPEDSLAAGQSCTPGGEIECSTGFCCTCSVGGNRCLDTGVASNCNDYCQKLANPDPGTNDCQSPTCSSIGAEECVDGRKRRCTNFFCNNNNNSYLAWQDIGTCSTTPPPGGNNTCPNGGTAVGCAYFHCVNGDTNNDGQCTAADAGVIQQIRNDTSCSTGGSCWQTDYYTGLDGDRPDFNTYCGHVGDLSDAVCNPTSPPPPGSTTCYRCTTRLDDQNQCESQTVTGTTCPAGWSANSACEQAVGGACPTETIIADCGETCETDDDCTDGLTCDTDNDRCILDACVDNNQCTNNGCGLPNPVCGDPCTTNSDCPSGNSCDPDTDRCVLTQCLNNSNCTNNGCTVPLPSTALINKTADRLLIGMLAILVGLIALKFDYITGAKNLWYGFEQFRIDTRESQIRKRREKFEEKVTSER